MTQIDELQRRITQALDRIAKGVEAVESRAVDPAAATAPDGADAEELVALREALEDERLANAQLEERVRAIREKQETEVAQLRAQASGSSATLGRLDGELQRLRRANEMLSATNVELRNALEQNVGEPHLINKAMLAELEALRAARAADMAENQLLLDTLEPLLAEAASEESA
ncbi:hypothetical protein DU478_07610 [Thalassococcus profundi]|uniref:Colicin transporter n=1 Tax=Thalassococcus profundi TaxID=2282382 RepID=A0A369TNE0_9RHOB|nr:hypothetical protein [Thalassococcus profundi]RDD66811.1 hypothetical protein DU478_07610 [Thalassococcus profundi]